VLICWESYCFRYLLKKGNKPRLIGVIGDQTPTKNEIDYWTIFLNQETAVFSGAEKLAKKLNCPVVFVHIDKIKNGFGFNYCRSFA
jgi:KDO2-lipid IV(A) lauroyltransferase